MEPDNCPECGVSFQGDPIPEESRHYYGTATHYSRVIGWTDSTKDITTHWICPDCKHLWER
jgi:predicted Zn-ribbon and HTH transcriptional regulator